MKELSKEQIELAINCLKSIVEFRGLSQTQLEQQSGVNQSTISKMFSRAADPSLDILKRLYQSLGLNLASVLHEGVDSPQDLWGYLATPLTGLSDQEESELQTIVAQIKNEAQSFSSPRMDLYWPGEHTHPVKNAEISPEQVYLRDRSRASTHDFVIIFCGSPSYGVGQENEIATQAGLPAIRIAPKGVSRMMLGSFIKSFQVNYDGSLEGGVSIDLGQLRSAFESIRVIHFKHRAFYRHMKEDCFPSRLKQLADDRAGDYRLLADEIGISLPYLHALMREQIAVSNPSAQLLKRLAIRLGTSVAYLLGETEDTDPLWVESNASWRKWIDETPSLEASLALAIRDEWRHEYRLNQNGQSTASFRRSSQTVTEADWQQRYQQKLKKVGTSATPKLF